MKRDIKVVPDTTTVVPGTVTVTMSIPEAEAVLSLLGKVCARGRTWGLFNALDRAGVKTERYIVNAGWTTAEVTGLTLVRQGA